MKTQQNLKFALVFWDGWYLSGVLDKSQTKLFRVGKEIKSTKKLLTLIGNEYENAGAYLDLKEDAKIVRYFDNLEDMRSFHKSFSRIEREYREKNFGIVYVSELNTKCYPVELFLQNFPLNA